ncbi:MAG: HNH endonuclease [Cytophagales bacterium]|jgi:5-methylcytosine-specific restriction endonuclease McrA|nr:HNH endonuclease [Cyclobacteriaceae bacterium]|tara:strand:+ start:598 stop:1104 length:507 start_codon:yes stop_codon:yes gene_type:complete
MMGVLVLNQDFTPLALCHVNRAFLLIFNAKAELVSESKSRVLRSISQSYAYPSVIKLNRYVNLPYRSVILNRHNIFKRDQNKCQYCGQIQDLTLDHLIPRSRGGKSIWTNLVTACLSCNAKKGDKLISETDLILYKKPIKPSFIMFLKNLNHQKQNEWAPFLEPKSHS